MEKSSLTALAREKLATAQSASSGRAAETVYGGHEHVLRQTVVALVSGQVMDEHENPGEATLQVLQGRIRLATSETSWDGTPGDLLVIPHGAADLPTAIEQVVAVRRAAQDLALERGFREAVLVADEGGLGLRLAGNRAALELLTTAIARAGLEPGVDASIAIDVAATEWAHGDGYELASEGRRIDAATLVAELAEWADSSPIVSIEDPLAEDDWDGWHAIGSRLGDRVQLLGDDLFATDPARLARGIREGVADAVLVKVNQNGTVSGAHRVVETARAAGYATVVSARSGDTEESWLADLAAGWRAGQIKVGSTHRSERNAKWNRLLELAATEETVFAGPWPISPGTGRARPPRRMS